MSALITVLVAVLLQQVPARDRAVSAAVRETGTASVSGVVLTDGENPQPVRHATVGLSTGVLSLPRMMVSDEEGRFTFTDLPEGSYRVVAQKPAWVPVASGVRTGGGITGMAGVAGKGVPVAVREGQTVEGITLRLQRGAVISGVVRMPGGHAAAGMTVQALQASRVDGTRVASMIAQPGTTDDQGHYRIYGLEPGEYVVQVRTSFGPVGNQEVRQVLPSEVAWAEGVAAQARAARVPGAQAAGLSTAPDMGPTVAYATTYFPGTSYLSDAAAVVVRAGEERLGVDVEVRQVPTATITGSVTGVDGRPAPSAMVSLALPKSSGQENLVEQLIGAAQAFTRADGTFVMTGVQPGAYVLNVRAAPPAPAGARAGAASASPEAAMMAGLMAGLAGGGMGAAGGTMSLWAREPVQVDGLPVGPLGLQLREGLSVSGTVVFEGDQAPAAESVRVTLSEPQANTGMPDIAMLRMNPSVGQTTAEGAFTVNGVVPGRYQLTVMMPGLRLTPTEPGEGWMIKSLRLGDRDLADDGVDLNDGASLSGLVLTLTNRPSELSGRVLDAQSQPFSAFPLVVFSADRAHWGVGSRRVQTVQPATDGSYVIAGLPAGAYYLAAVTNVDTRELASAVFLESLIASSLSVTLSDGERKTQDVRLAGQ